MALTAAAAVAVGLALAWWPAGQYQPVRQSDPGTLPALGRLIADPASALRAAPASAGTRLALAMIPVGGASRSRPAMFVIPGADGQLTTELLSYSSGTSQLLAALFPFTIPRQHGPGHTQAVAIGSHNGGVTYDIAYAIVTVRNGAPVNETNSAFAFAQCVRCTTVAVSFQVVLVVGQSNVVAPVNVAGALNRECPQCTTTRSPTSWCSPCPTSPRRSSSPR